MPTRTVSVFDATRNLTDVINRSKYAGEHTIITKRGKPYAAIIPLEDLELLEKTKLDLKNAEALECLGAFGRAVKNQRAADGEG